MDFNARYHVRNIFKLVIIISTLWILDSFYFPFLVYIAFKAFRAIAVNIYGILFSLGKVKEKFLCVSSLNACLSKSMQVSTKAT